MLLSLLHLDLIPRELLFLMLRGMHGTAAVCFSLFQTPPDGHLGYFQSFTSVRLVPRASLLILWERL